MNIKSGINWTKSAIALALLCAVFGFGVIAQDNPNQTLGTGFNPATKSIFIRSDFSGKIDFGETELTTKGRNRHAFLAEVSEGE